MGDNDQDKPHGVIGSSRLDRIAALDVGSNSIRLVVSEIDADGRYTVLDEEREMTRLVRGLDRSGRISEEAMQRSIAAIGRMKAVADGFEVDDLWTVATNAVREAENRDEFCERVRKHTGVAIEVISTNMEARLVLLSAANRFDLGSRRAAVVDIGGGSVELVLCGGGLVEQIHSLPLGGVRLSDRFDNPAPWTGKSLKKLCKTIDADLQGHVGRLLFEPEVMIGSGGTFTALGQMIRCEREREPGPVQGYLVSRTEVDDLAERLSGMSLAELRDAPGLSPLRADIIVAGAYVVARLAAKLNVQQILISEQGLREGMLLSMIQRRRGFTAAAASQPEGRLGAVRSFARKCRSHETHCEHVADLALQIFDNLCAVHALPADAREILLAGAILHDIGYLIGHEKHHKHAYHLIVHSALPGFSTRELELIANVARYHRRARPRKAHPNYAKLCPEDRQLVTKLSAILRIADALDRTHLKHVQSLSAQRRGTVTQIILRSAGNIGVEVDYAMRKGGLFERIFDTRLRFLTAPARRVVQCETSGDVPVEQAVGV